MAAQLFLDKSGGSTGLDVGTVGSALNNLLPGDGNDLNIGALVSQFGSGDLASMVGSWLGDGDNDSITGTNIIDALGGIDTNKASEGLAGMIPELINKNSSGGSLLDSVGGAGGVASLVEKLF
jgi:uncharacterized protein YidB (DUF937 family)